MTLDSDALRVALGECQRVLAMMIDPKGKGSGTAIISAYAQCVEAEAKARKALDLPAPASVAELQAEVAKQREHIRKQAEDVMTLGKLVYDENCMSWKDRAEAAEARVAEAEELRRNWHGLFLDGRNEHGTHVLPLPQRSFDLEADDMGCESEDVMIAAEAVGYEAGQAVVGLFRLIQDLDDAGYWEFVGISESLTKALYGNAAEQKAEAAHSFLESRP